MEGDVVWLESPNNPHCYCYDISKFADRVRAVNATLVVDCTFAPPPVQYALKNGADMVMHSSSKFLTGHSDALGGALVVKEKKTGDKLRSQRLVLGSAFTISEQYIIVYLLKI